MSEVADSPKTSCYGCVHLRYKGPSRGRSAGRRRSQVAGEAPIPVYPDEQVSPGRYQCAKLGGGERLLDICSADAKPEPLVAGGECKEAR